MDSNIIDFTIPPGIPVAMDMVMATVTDMGMAMDMGMATDRATESKKRKKLLRPRLHQVCPL